MKWSWERNTTTGPKDEPDSSALLVPTPPNLECNDHRSDTQLATVEQAKRERGFSWYRSLVVVKNINNASASL